MRLLARFSCCSEVRLQSTGRVENRLLLSCKLLSFVRLLKTSGGRSVSRLFPSVLLRRPATSTQRAPEGEREGAALRMGGRAPHVLAVRLGLGWDGRMPFGRAGAHHGCAFASVMQRRSPAAAAE